MTTLICQCECTGIVVPKEVASVNRLSQEGSSRSLAWMAKTFRVLRPQVLQARAVIAQATNHMYLSPVCGNPRHGLPKGVLHRAPVPTRLPTALPEHVSCAISTTQQRQP